jgi:hypothetical protein
MYLYELEKEFLKRGIWRTEKVNITSGIFNNSGAGKS